MAQDTFYDLDVDPFNGDEVYITHIQSTEYSGAYNDLTAPASPNFPRTSPTRYFLALPELPYIEDYLTYPLIIKDATTSTVLTRVTGSPGSNEFRVSPATSKRAHIIELNSGQAGHTIGFDYYSFGRILNADFYNDPYVGGDIEADGNVNSGNGVGNVNGVYADYGASSSAKLRFEIIEIGDWDMDSTPQITVTPNHCSDNAYIVSIYAIVRVDSDVSIGVENYPINYYAISGSSAGNIGIDTSGHYIYMNRVTGGLFDSTNFDDTSYNRGWVFIAYWELNV